MSHLCEYLIYSELKHSLTKKVQRVQEKTYTNKYIWKHESLKPCITLITSNNSSHTEKSTQTFQSKTFVENIFRKKVQEFQLNG